MPSGARCQRRGSPDGRPAGRQRRRPTCEDVSPGHSSHEVAGEARHYFRCPWLPSERLGAEWALRGTCLAEGPWGVFTLAGGGTGHRPPKLFERLGLQPCEERASRRSRAEAMQRSTLGPVIPAHQANPGSTGEHPCGEVVGLPLIDRRGAREGVGLRTGISLNGREPPSESLGPPDQERIRHVMDRPLLDLEGSSIRTSCSSMSRLRGIASRDSSSTSMLLGP